MKSRITTFYNDHKIMVATFCIGVAVGTTVCANAARKGMLGMSVDSGDIFTRDDGLMIMAIHHMNGRETLLSLTPNEK